MNGLTDEQVAVLLKGIAPHRIADDGQGHAAVEQWDIRAMLTRVFGFCGWSWECSTTELWDRDTTLKPPKPGMDGKPGVYVAYRAHGTLTIHANGAQYDGEAVASGTLPDYLRADCHHQAMTTAASTALKRAAINLGDQFGLSLYRKGSPEPVVKRVVGFDPPDEGVGS